MGSNIKTIGYLLGENAVYGAFFVIPSAYVLIELFFILSLFTTYIDML